MKDLRWRACHDHRTIKCVVKFHDLAKAVGDPCYGATHHIVADDLRRVERAARYAVVCAVRDGAMADRQHRVRRAGGVANDRAGQGQRPAADADAVHVGVRLRDHVAERQLGIRAPLAVVDRLAGGRTDRQRHPRQAHHSHRLGERQRDVDGLQPLVGRAHLRVVEGDGADARRALAAVYRVGGIVGDGAGEVQPRVCRAAAQDDAAAVQRQGAGANADAVPIRVAGDNRIA